MTQYEELKDALATVILSNIPDHVLEIYGVCIEDGVEGDKWNIALALLREWRDSYNVLLQDLINFNEDMNRGRITWKNPNYDKPWGATYDHITIGDKHE